MNAVEPVLLFIGTELVVCLRIECPCQDAVLQQRNVSFQTVPLPHHALLQVQLLPEKLTPNKLLRFICSVPTQVECTSTIIF